MPIRSITPVGPDTIAIEVDTPAGFEGYPGQFVLLRATIEGEEYARHYTISSPRVEDTFELTVGVEPNGAFSTWLGGRKPGDELTLEGPFGEIYYDDGGAVRVLVGGPGVGAGLGVVERALEQGYDAGIVAYVEPGALSHQSRFSSLASDGHPAYVATTEAGFTHGVSRLQSKLPTGTPFVFGFRPFVELASQAIEDSGGDIETAMIESYG